MFILLLVLFTVVAIRPVRSDDAGFALTFNGATNHVQLGGTNQIMQGNSWTNTIAVSVWLRPEGASSPVTHPSAGQLIVGNDRPRLLGISRATYNGQDRIWVWNADSDSIDVIGIEFTPNEWLQVTLVHTNGVLSAYKNGQLVGSLPSGDTMFPGGSGGTLYIGGNGRTTASSHFFGDIDEVRLWNVGLDQNTIQAWTYQVVTPNHPNWANLVAYYQMSNGVGTLLTDNSANNNTGTLTGGMSDSNWITSGAFLLPGTPTPTAVTPTTTPTQTPAAPTATPTETPVQPTSTPTTTPAVTATPSATPTNVTPSPTAVPGSDYALSFDGNNDYVRLAETSVMMATGWQATKTVSLWVKPMGSAVCIFQSPSHCDAIFGDRPRWWGISRGTVNGNDRIWVWNYDGDFDQVGIEYTVGEWVHIAMVHANGQLLAYKNGILIGSVPSGATVQPSTGAYPVLHLGGVINNVDRNWTFAGHLDEVQIWNIARSQAELMQDMSQPLTGSEAGLAAYYQMSNGSGLSLTDNSGHGWTGTLFDGGQGVPPDGQPPQWISPGVFGGEPMPTVTPTNTSVPPSPTATPDGTATNTPTPTNTATPPPPTATPTTTPTATAVPPTPTSTPAGPTPTPGSGDNHALQFDGIANYMRLGTTDDVMGSGNWRNEKTVSVWVKPLPGNSPATQPSAGLLLVGNDRPRNFGITRATFNGADRIWVWNADASSVAIVGIDFTPGEWVHIALVHSGGTLYAYKNGQLVGSVASGATNAPGGVGTVFAGGTGRGQYLAGDLDEIRIWGVALDAPTLQAWMYQEVTAGHPQWAHLLAYYQMNEGAGTAVTDSSPHDHNATLQGGMNDNNWVPGPW